MMYPRLFLARNLLKDDGVIFVSIDDNEVDDLFGLININGNNNSIIANHISETIHVKAVKPEGAKPVIIHVASGVGNYISDNHIVATSEKLDNDIDTTDSCFASQVGALLNIDILDALDVVTVLVENESFGNTVLDSGTATQVIINKSVNAFRATPDIAMNPK